MLRFIRYLTLTGLILSASSVYAGDMVEHQVPHPSEAIKYWTKEKMQSAIPVPMPTLSTDEIQAFSATSESATELQEALTQNEGVQELLTEGVEPRKTFKKAKYKHWKAYKKRAKHKHRSKYTPRFKRKRQIVHKICDGESSCTTFLPEKLRDRNPHIAIGKVFFTLRGFDFVCSAASVTSRNPGGPGNRRTILTAGHCLNDGGGIFATSFVFVPAYDQGEAPYGIWPATNLFTTSQWNSGQGLAFARDVGLALAAPGNGDYAGENLHDVVGALGITFNKKKLLGNKYALNGYPVENFGGEEPIITLGSVSVLDPNFLPNPVGVPSLLTGGASGGPWLLSYLPDISHIKSWKIYKGGRYYEGWKYFKRWRQRNNTINGINAYLYTGVDVVYTPYFDSEIYNVLQFVAQQP